MGAVATIVTTIAVTAGAVALYRFVDAKRRELAEILSETRAATASQRQSAVIDYERDPTTGVYRPKS